MNVLTASRCHGSPDFQISPGEIHFLWWFIQGSIMNPSTRERLRKAWGMCERHAWGWMVVEAAFRSGYMHGPAVLYEDLMGPAMGAFKMLGPMQHGRLKRRLRLRGPCLMCEEGFGPDSQGYVRTDIIRQGRDLRALQSLARRTARYWTETVCGKCSGDDSPIRCRRHLIEDAAIGQSDDFSSHRAHVTYIAQHLVAYAGSFQFEFKGTQTLEDEAALISAVGWCSGWKLFLSIVGVPTSPLPQMEAG
ncbi:MAG: hypothetical protein RDU20_18635 [Desulfomonilaceae bacterium]|nr:hypothetical protein [Desulfomonilaceae bacterium]